MSLIKQSARSRQRAANATIAAESLGQPTSAKNVAGKAFKFSTMLKLLIWAYLFLLIFDGALRKWFMPGLSDVLLVSRVPVIAAIYLLAFPARLFVFNGFVIASLILAILTTPMALLAHGSISVAVFGALVNYFSIPLIFIMPKVIDYDDTEKMGRVLLFLVIPMTVLIGMQFYAPQSAWVNRSVGGVEGAGFTGALGRFRPPGTFSFISGVAQYYTLAFAFFMAQFVNRRTLPLWFLLPTGAAFVMAIYGSISRLLALSVIMVFVFCVIGMVINGKKLHNTLKIGLAMVVIFLIASQFTYFSDGVETFMARWEQAKGGEESAEGAVVDRTLGSLFDPLINPDFDVPFGRGLGLGTNVGAKLAVGQRTFLGGENEWARILMELGPLFGYVYIIMRVALVLVLAAYAYQSLRAGNILPWLIFFSALFLILNGQWGQQTTLGFAILSAGFVLSSGIQRLKPPSIESLDKPQKPSRRFTAQV